MRAGFRPVFIRDFLRQTFSVGQIIMLSLMIALIALLAVAPRIVPAIGAAEPTVLVAGDGVRGLGIAQIESTLDLPVEQVSSMPETLDSGEVAVRMTASGLQVDVRDSSDLPVADQIGRQLQLAILANESSSPALDVTSVAAQDNSALVVSRLLALLSTLLIFMQMTAKGSWVFGSIARDLQLGIFDVILARVDSKAVLAGKVCASLASGLLQIAVLSCVAILALHASGQSTTAALVLDVVPVVAAWAVGGMVLLVLLYASMAMVFRSPAAAGTVGVAMQFVSIGLFSVAILALLDPAASWVRFVSLVPPFSPLLSPLRIIEGSMSFSDVLVASGLLLVTSVVAALLAAKVFEAAVSSDGGKETLTHLRRSLLHAG